MCHTTHKNVAFISVIFIIDCRIYQINDVNPLKFITPQNITNNNNTIASDKSTNDTNFCQVIEIKKNGNGHSFFFSLSFDYTYFVEIKHFINFDNDSDVDDDDGGGGGGGDDDK